MAEFRSYYPQQDAISINLSEIAERFEHLSEQELGHIRELAIEIAQEHESLADVITALPDRAPLSYELQNTESPEESRSVLKSRNLLWSFHRRLLLCLELEKKLSEKAPLSAEAFFEDNQITSTTADCRILYQKNSYTDAAYLQFASILDAPRAAYAHSFPAACEDVFNGICEYCILPIENTSEGTLHSFLRLIDRYDLKISATCEISNNTSDRTTQFALLCKHPRSSLAIQRQADFFAFSVRADESDLSQILTAANMFGLKLHRLDILPASAQSMSMRIILRIDEGNLGAFLLYLAMDLPEYTPMGLYVHI